MFKIKFPSRKRRTDAGVQNPEQVEVPKPKELQLIDIPWNRFLKFLVEKDFDVIGGPEHADRLYTDYLDSIMNMKLANVIHLENQMLVLKAKISVTQTIIDSLLEAYTDRMADLLREWYPYPLIEETYRQDIECIIAEGQVLLSDYELYLSQKEKLIGGKSDQTEDSKQKRYQYYADLMAEVCKMPGVGFVPYDANTQHVCSLIKQLFALYDKQKLSANGKRSDQ